MHLLLPEALDARLRSFLEEDIGGRDVTTEATVPSSAMAAGRLLARSECVVSGLAAARRTFELLDPALAWSAAAAAGDRVLPGTPVARLSGHARALLTAERVALNLLQRMSGIATETRRFVDAVAGTGCRIYDTRKTAPGLRAFDREAVRDGGGENHRDTLADMVLIKDNHRRLAGGVGAAVASARRLLPPGGVIEVEVESEGELSEALATGADRILIDNQSPETVKRWTALARRGNPPPWIEASGNMTLATVREYALAGPDCVSVGALTHSVRAADLALDLDLEPPRG
ncbi:MAG: carboxylating nicotinate-nucleotide diphosphorylase [Acidobacteriota bacterium]|nr:carboxylating nicotinate-nucleotide diphosphorylase [Acidobacteriota bacterium]